MTTTTLQATQETAATRARDLTKTYGRGMGEIKKPLGITVYGCEQDEADIFYELSARLGVVPTITSDAVSEPASFRCPETDASVWDTSPRFPGENFLR